MKNTAQKKQNHKNQEELSMNNMDEVNAGKGAFTIPSKPIADTLTSIVCGGHKWVQTGREGERPFLVFWSRHQHQYVCTKCGKRTWKDD